MSVTDQAYSALKYALLIAFIVATFVFITSFERVTVTRKDKAMRLTANPIGDQETFTIYPDIRRPEQLETGDIVAFEPAAAPEGMEIRLARVLAVAGQTIEISPGKRLKAEFRVDGRPVPTFPQKSAVKLEIPKFVVPAGCVYIIFEDATMTGDSLTTGPLPWRRILGKVKVKG